MPATDIRRRVEIGAETLMQLENVGTATLSALLMRRGVRSVFLTGVLPLNPHTHMVGRAFTLRYIPAREDMPGGEGLDDLTNLQRQGVETVGPGEVFVIDAHGNTDAGCLGDILAARIFKRGAPGIVTDGAFRDTPSIRNLGQPVYARGMHPAVSTTRHFAADIQIPIACGGVMVCPGDLLVGDGEGVIVVPQAIAADVAAEATEYEPKEIFIRELIDSGRSIKGVYPPDAETLAAYEQWKLKQ
ncbi:MAG: ribonuclease activity regulator RraA [Chloroflexota bacterium]|nr:ribonuclease activity regulator RraA [Chloroflexota bacterium]